MNRDEEIYAAAVGLPAAERGALLGRECGADPILRARVEALLAGNDDADAFFTNSALTRLSKWAAVFSSPHTGQTSSVEFN